MARDPARSARLRAEARARALAISNARTARLRSAGRLRSAMLRATLKAAAAKRLPQMRAEARAKALARVAERRAAAKAKAKAALRKKQLASQKTGLVPMGTPGHLSRSISTTRAHLDSAGRIVLPLRRGTSDRAILANAKQLIRNGWNPKQALRSSISAARKSTVSSKPFRASRKVF